MEKHKKLVRVVCLVLAALMVMTIGVPLIFAYAETPAEKLERLRKELEDIKSNISAVENSKEKSEQTKQYYQAQANNLKAQLAAIKEDIAAQQQSIELKNAEVAEKAANVAYNKSMFESRLKGMYEMSRQSNLAILLGIDDVSQMLLFAENLQQISEHDTQLVQQLRDEQAALEAQRAELEQQLADLAAREQELTGEHQQPLDLRNFRKDIPRLRPCYHLRPYVGARCKRRRLRDAGPAHRLCGEHGQQYGQPPAF